jgi:hypothetical protein
VEPLSINRPIPFGRHRDGSTAAALLRRQSFVIVGEPDSGKSVGLHVFNAGLMRCPDALVWHIDLGGAGLSAPWIGPWLDGDMARPVVDWVAHDLDEALLMTETAIQIVKGRRAVYREWMRRQNTDVLPVSAEIPAIEILMDEVAEGVGVAGHPALQERVVRINQLGRFVAVRMGVAALRATTDVLPKAAMTSIGARIGMRVADDAELSYLMGWKLRFDPSAYPYPGCGLWRPGNSGPPPEKFRFYDLSEPERLERLAWACEPWRPALDEGSLSTVHPDLRALYATRWERTGAALSGDWTGGSPSPAHPGPRAQVQMSPAGPVSPSGSARPAPDVSRLDAKIDHARRVIASEQRKARLDVDSEWAALAGHLADDRAAGGAGWADDDGATEPRARMRQLVDAAGDDGVSISKILKSLADEGHDVPKPTLYRWLKKDTTDGGYGIWRRKGEQP